MTVYRPLLSTALSLVLVAGAGTALAQSSNDNSGAMANQTAMDRGFVDYESLYQNGRSVQSMIGTLDVNGPEEEDIGEVDDLVIGPDGDVLAVIVEVGGFLDIGDTHVSIPWDDVSFNANGDGINIPITDDTIDEYDSLDREMIESGIVNDQMIAGVDDAYAAGDLTRASQMIGDYARIQNDETWADYGMVNDLVLVDGKIASVIITPQMDGDVRDYYATPYWGYGGDYGFDMTADRYNMPYDEVEISELDTFDYDAMATY